VAAPTCDAVNLADYERLAEDVLDPATHAFLFGGAGDEWTVRANLSAFGRWCLRPRVLVDVDRVSTAVNLLGLELALPFLVAPMGLQRLAHPEAELATARAAAAVGVAFCNSAVSSTSPADVAAAAPGGVHWLQLYSFRDRGLTEDLVAQAVAAGFRALVLTVDGPAVGRRESPLRTAFAFPPDLTVPGCRGATPTQLAAGLDRTLGWGDLERLGGLSKLPLLLKGVLTADDAALACEHGVAGVVVSNHGGRQLDGVPATLEVLPEVVEAVAGRAEVLLDGGIRRGTDIVKALALGASAVLVGRPVMWALAAGGEVGVRTALQLLRAELELALRLLGCPRVSAVTRTYLRPCWTPR